MYGGYSTGHSYDTLDLAWSMYEAIEIPRISTLTVYYRDNSYWNDPYVLGLGVEYMNSEGTQDVHYTSKKYGTEDCFILEIVLE